MGNSTPGQVTRVFAILLVAAGKYQCLGQITATSMEVGGDSHVTLRSPDGRSGIITKGETDTDDYAYFSVVTDGKPTRLLGKYFRSALLAWGPDSRSVVCIDHHSPEDDALRIFKLEPKRDWTEIVDADSKVRIPALTRAGGGELASYVLSIIGFEGPSHLIVAVHLRHLMPGHSTGQTKAMEMQFIFDLRSGLAKAR